jgi:hypothetical protein
LKIGTEGSSIERTEITYSGQTQSKRKSTARNLKFWCTPNKVEVINHTRREDYLPQVRRSLLFHLDATGRRRISISKRKKKNLLRYIKKT